MKDDHQNPLHIYGFFSSYSAIEDPAYTKQKFVINNNTIGDVCTKQIDNKVSISVLYQKKKEL